MLKLEEIFFKEFYVNPEIIIIRKGNDGTIFEINDTFCNILGYSRESLLGKKYEDFNFFIDDKNKSIYLDNVRFKNETRNLNLKLYDKEKELLNVNLTENIINADGEPYFITIINYENIRSKINKRIGKKVTDKTMRNESRKSESDDLMIQIERFISDRNRAERFLLDSEKRHRSFFDDLPIGAYRTTEDGRFLSVNNAFAILLGFDNPEDLKKHNAMEFYMRSQDRTSLIEKQKKVYGIVKAEYKVKRMDGNVIWVRDNGKVIYKDDGSVDYLEGVLEDITRQKLAQASLIESEVKYKKLFENLYDIYFSITLEGEFTEISPSAETILGYYPDDIIGRTIFDYVDNRQFLNEALSDLKKSLKILNRALLIRNKQGDDVHLLINAYFYFDNIRNKRSIAGIARDISIQKQYEIDLLEAREYAELINRVTPSCTFTVDKNGIITSWNERTAALTGYSASDVIGKKCSLCLWNGYHKECAFFDDRIKKPVYGREIEIKIKSGDTRIIAVNIDYLRNSVGEIIGGIESFDDITDRIRTEEALFWQAGVNHAFADLSKAIISMLSVKDTSKLILEHARRLTNSTFGFISVFNQETLKFEISAIMSSQTKDYIHWEFYPEDVEFNDFWYWTYINKHYILTSSAKSDDRLNSIYQYYKDIEHFVSVPLVSNNDVIGIIAIASMDNPYGEDDLEILNRMSSLFIVVLQRIKAEDDIKSALVKEQELSELKSRFISMISHEYRTPLTAIALTKDLLKEHWEKIDVQTRIEQLDKIQHSIDVMNSLLDDIIMYSKVEVGKQIYRQRKINISQFCLDIVNEIQYTANYKVKINFEFTGDNKVIYTDENLLRQIVRNLLSNAIKFSSHGSEVDFQIASSENEITYTVTDYGVGIPDDDKENVFEPFFRGKNIITTSGTGLGLSIVKNAVNILGGNVSFHSEIGKGTAFKVVIPGKTNN
ncbi:MAG: PAS domain S-box protein [Bacteroidetes bacterium]|nr:MAG: PAS domain S-box protein [Bacteroidota bacterium]